MLPDNLRRKAKDYRAETEPALKLGRPTSSSARLHIHGPNSITGRPVAFVGGPDSHFPGTKLTVIADNKAFTLLDFASLYLADAIENIGHEITFTNLRPRVQPPGRFNAAMSGTYTVTPVTHVDVNKNSPPVLPDFDMTVEHLTSHEAGGLYTKNIIVIPGDLHEDRTGVWSTTAIVIDGIHAHPHVHMDVPLTMDLTTKPAAMQDLIIARCKNPTFTTRALVLLDASYTEPDVQSGITTRNDTAVLAVPPNSALLLSALPYVDPSALTFGSTDYTGNITGTLHLQSALKMCGTCGTKLPLQANTACNDHPNPTDLCNGTVLTFVGTIYTTATDAFDALKVLCTADTAATILDIPNLSANMHTTPDLTLNTVRTTGPIIGRLEIIDGFIQGHM